MDFITVHKKIMFALEKMVQENNNGTIKLERLARLTQSDSRTVRKHLEIAEIHNVGKFIDQEKKIFCVRRIGNILDN